MIDFDLTDEQRSLQELARRFAREQIDPVARAHDASAEFPRAVVEKAFQVGLVNLNVPEAHGGPGLGVLEECLVAEELAAGCAGIAASLGLSALSATPIILAGSDAQKARWLPRLSTQGQLAAYALTEPAVGSDAARLETTARREGDAYVLSGTKSFISNASVANFFVVFASTDRAAGPRGVSAFVVDRSLPGVSVGRKDDKMGQRAADTAQVHLEDVRVPAGDRLGAEGEGFRIAMRTFDRTRPAVASLAVGVARRALSLSVEYARTRQSMGKPLVEHQAIGIKLAEMAMKVAASRHLVRHAAWLADQGRPSTLEASFAKAFAADACMEATTEAVQIHGGYGYTKEYLVEKLMRDAKVFQIYEGTSEIQRLIIVRELVRAAGS